MTDEKYEFMQDCKEKKFTARSARNKRTHTGKGGRVRFPSDYLSAKEREAMNGECVSYRMNEPITWEEFKSWPDEHQKTYILLLRKKFNVPDKDIAEMMGVSTWTISNKINDLGLGVGKNGRTVRTWDKESFLAWRSGAKDGTVKSSETPIVEDSDDEFNYKPMVWNEFKYLSDETKINYIKALRKKFNITNPAIADMLGIDRTHFRKAVIVPLELNEHTTPGYHVWDRKGFMAWRGLNNTESVDISEPIPEPEEKDELIAVNEQPELVIPEEVHVSPDVKAEAMYEAFKKSIAEAKPVIVPDICVNPYHHMPVIPKSGTMSFDNNHADDVLATIKSLLSDVRVNITISWETVV